MNEALITALEASWELDPVRMEKKLWDAVDKRPDREKDEERRENAEKKKA